jgi:hypothetical protein
MKRTVFSSVWPLTLLTALALLNSASAQAQSGCYAHRPKYIEGVFEVKYDSNCTGHDEPELDPVSSAPGSARELTWTFILPSDGASPVSATGPTFGRRRGHGPEEHLRAVLCGVAVLPGRDRAVARKMVIRREVRTNVYSVCSPVWRLTSRPEGVS